MKALSIRQPWAWLIIHGGKDIENRSWHTKFRGRFLVHAAQGMTRLEYNYVAGHGETVGFLEDAGIDVKLPAFEDLQRGGVIGSVELLDSLSDCNSPWYMGDKGFWLRDPKPLPFTPLKGRLGFFEVPDELVTP
ncbi:ASCH domain-containing protein [Pseudomonas extremaustralis]|uniref:ASCH domain-containing protein n=1 Tax=Pseudomonas extremaustralis TaxID=359110 RepID=UPI0023074105|nr:ASCH domain-containing protein [Pseudomonas extremaustralis]MDB1113721.1 ASCH domain-containing protein [Pseudomonas extremaustralis]